MSEGIDIARERIAKEAAARTGFLDLGRLGLEHLPDELFALDHLRALNLGRFYHSDDGGYHRAESNITPNRLGDDLARLSCLAHLKTLTCSATQVIDLSPLASLSSLETLYCYSTQVSDLTPLASLSSLEILNCSSTQVIDLSPLASLSSLETLTCSGTQVSDLTPLASLSSLETLTCSSIQVSDLTPLASLSSLESLDCSSIQVSDLTPLASLSSLETLYCYSTQVSDLTPLAGLANLEKLDIHGCTIDGWPNEFWHKTSLKTVEATGAELRGIPADILQIGLLENCLPAIRAHLDDLGDEPERLTDVKLIVLGNGRIGKTQIVNRLRGKSYDKDADSTHGVSLVQASIPGSSEEKFNIWDFGGQDIYFGTHMLFLKSRAVFMLVWTPEADDSESHEHGGMTFRNQPVTWWLDCIRRFGHTASPLVVVQNQLDRYGYCGDHPALADIQENRKFYRPVAYSAATDEGRGALDDHLKHAAKRFNPPLIGKGRLSVMRELQKRREEDQGREPEDRRHRTLSFAAFERLCQETSWVSDPVQFLNFLHNAGQVFWRENLFQNRVILDQAWVLDAVYTVFHRENCLGFIRRHHGRFTRSDLGMLIWDSADYSLDEQKLFLSFMQSCGICFVLREGSEDIETVYVAPDHLPEDWEAGARQERWGQASPDAEVAFAYGSLPPALMRNLLGRIGGDAGLSCDYWRNGFYGYESRTDARVLVEQEMDDRWKGTIRIQARGGRAAELVAEIEKALLEEERRLGLSSERQGAERPVKEPDREEGAAESVSAKLDFGPEPRKTRTYFVSYAWEDASSSLVDAFCSRAEEQGITIRRDKDVMKLGDSIARFMSDLVQGDRVIVVLSDKYLRSPFCMYELYQIWVQARHDEDRFRKRIRVFTQKDASVETIPDRAAYALHWDKECERNVAATKDSFHLLDPEDQREISNMREFASQVAKILRVVKNTLQPRNLDELISYSFDDGAFDD